MRGRPTEEPEDTLVVEVDGGGAAHALGDVVAGELDVDAARHGAEGAVHLEEALDLLDDVSGNVMSAFVRATKPAA